MSGPTRTPTAILERRGSWRAKTRKGEPRPAAGDITAPGWLSTEARAVWDELAPRLKNLGVLTELDTGVLGRYCVYWVLWKNLVMSKKKNNTVLDRYANQLRHLEKELGITPSARSFFNVQEPKADKFFRIV